VKAARHRRPTQTARIPGGGTEGARSTHKTTPVCRWPRPRRPADLREWPRFGQLETGSGAAARRAKCQAGTAAAAVTGHGTTGAGPLGSAEQRVHTGPEH
jgi:hypothetical protein